MDPYPSLPAAPLALVHERGIPAFGMYQGIVEKIDWRPLAVPLLSRLTRKLHHKRWQYACVGGEAFFLGVAIVDTGWAATAFCYLFDRHTRQIEAGFSVTGLPHVHARLSDAVFGDAEFKSGPRRLTFKRQADRLELSIAAPEMRVAAHLPLTDTPPVLAAIAPANWLAHSTHKVGGLAAVGFVDAAGKRYSLNGATAALDSSNGLLARHTRWRWASAHNRELGFNLQAGFMGTAENALWLDGQLWRVGEVEFDFDPDRPDAPWTLQSKDGLVDLRFTPEGVRREDRNFGLARSRYVQPVGTFDGWLKPYPSAAPRPVSALLGVTEDHESLW